MTEHFEDRTERATEGRAIPGDNIDGDNAMQVTRKDTTSTGNKNLRITGILLVIWFVVTFVIGYFARDLSFTFFGWPFSFWVGGQGALIVYCVIIWYYARYMNKLDIEHNVHEED